MIDEDAAELMAAVQMAMLADLAYSRLRDAVLTHPTMADGARLSFNRLPIGVHDPEGDDF
jgi:pyruvate/2-oxoglutarate dehydrogenase complex dihydrolipoamide dehydrogenase (E3) component